MAFSVGVGPATNNAGSGTTLACTLNSTTVGRHIVVGVYWESASVTLDSISCSGESNLTLVGTPPSTGTRRVQLAYLADNTAGGNKTITATFGSSISGASIFAIEFYGGDTGDFFDAVVTGTGTSTNPSVSLSTTTANTLVVAIQQVAASASSVGAGYTDIAADTWNGSTDAEYDLDAGAAGSVTVNFTNASTAVWAIMAASFKALTTSPVRVPATGALALTGAQATSGASVSIMPSAGGIALAGRSPTVGSSLSPNVVPSVGSLSLSGLAASVATSTTNDGSVILLAHTLSAAVESDVISLAVTLPAHNVSATASSEGIATASITLLSHSIEAGGNHALNATLAAHALSATIVGGAVANAQVNLLVHSISSGATPVNVITADIRLLTHGISASGIPENVATLTRTLAAHRISADLLAGNTASATIELLAHTLNVLAFPESVATANIRLAAHYLDAYATASIAETFRAWVMNTRNGALSEYTNFQFNSVAKFGAVYLAAGSGGIYVLGGDTDAGDEIDARARTGQLNYGSSFLKRIPRLYVAHSADGDLVFRTITQEGGTRSYLLQVNGITGEQQRRVPVGTGPKSVRWQFELANRAGSDFELSAILVYPKTLRRRIQ